MPRIRTIKPDAFLSESLADVDRGTRWTFAGLWTYADDGGRARDDARLVKAALYPLDDSVTLEMVAHDLRELHRVGGICRYVVDGKAWLHMPEWAEHQRINRPSTIKSPPCPLHEGGGSGHTLPHDDSGSTHAPLTEPSPPEGKGREGNREGEGTFLSDASDDTDPLARFDEFWDTYGNKVGRAKCEVAYKRALTKRGVDDDRLISAAAQYVAWCAETDTFQKNPLTWLHGEHWDDELIRKPLRVVSTRQQETDDLFARAAARAEAADRAEAERRAIGGGDR